MSQTVLVTGATGFIATHIIRAFLDAGYKIRGTVRSESSKAKVQKVHPNHLDALSFAIVPDISAPNAFDEAIKGVDGVIHVASPFTLSATDYDKELFDPAVNGTVSVLKAATNNASIKRVVITSSFAAVLDFATGLRPGYTYTEADWNPMTKEEARQAGPAAAYLVSKTLAERAAFDFVDKEKPKFSIATLCPPMVYGPLIADLDSMKKLNESSGDMYRLFNGSEKTVPDTSFWAYVDVRDLAKAHLLAYTKDVAANQRYLIAAATYGYQNFVDIIREHFPDLRDSTPEGAAKQPLPDVYTLDTSKVRKDLGIEFRSMEETVVDTVSRLRELEKGATKQ